MSTKLMPSLLGENIAVIDNIPSRTLTALRSYRMQHTQCNDFLHSVLCNDLRTAIHFADDRHLAAIPEIIRWCYSVLPAEAWGSPKKVSLWLMGEEAFIAGQEF